MKKILMWIDKRSSLTQGKKRYKAGDIIPDGLLSAARIDNFITKKKADWAENIKNVSEKTTQQSVVDKINGVIEPVEPVEPIEPTEPTDTEKNYSDMTGAEQEEYVQTIDDIETLKNLIKDEATKSRTKPVIGKRISELKKDSE